MKSVTESCVVSINKNKVFEFLSKPENMPKWSTKFIKKIFTDGDNLKAITPLGEVFLRFETDAKTGVIDIYAGPTQKQMTAAFMRVTKLGKNSTGVTFTFFQYPDTDDKTWKMFCEWIKIEVGNIVKIFN